MAEARLPANEFYPVLLERTVFAISALGGEIWLAGAGDALHRVYQSYTDAYREPNPQTIGIVEASLREVLGSGQGKIFEPRNRRAPSIIACPIITDGQPWGALAFFVAPDVPQAAQHGFLRFGLAVADLACHYQHQTARDRLIAMASSRSRYDNYCIAAYGAWSLRDVAFHVVNEGRLLLDCDRLSLAIFRGRRSRVMAVSGVAEIGRGNEQIIRLQRLVDAVAKLGQPFFYTDDSRNLAPQVEQAIAHYLDESTARSIAIIPLIVANPDSLNQSAVGRNSPSRQYRPVGALIVEQFTLRPIHDMTEPLLSMSRHAAIAVDRALRIHQVPLLAPLLWRMGSARRFGAGWLTKWIWGIAGILVLCAAFSFIRTDFNITVRGELRPINERHVFAPADGIVTDLLIEHGQEVKSGDILLTLRSTEIDFESAKIRGELLTAQQRLVTIQAGRLQALSTDERTDREINQLSADELTLRKRISNLNEAYRILERQQEQLHIHSPIPGTVLTWNVAQKLNARPVRCGQILLSVGNLDGPWMLRLRVPDDLIGHIQTAIDRDGSPLDVSFVMATSPRKSYQARTRQIGIATQVDRPNDEPVVFLTADFDREEVRELRPGASVVAKVHCGRASYLYVWLHGFYEELSRRFF
ncbi:MAG: biotin/lipoyl-binding protein [Pirellulales bacterium]|nr:biotin/lipoyl-binding protein [Pirellulales bacterium]